MRRCHDDTDGVGRPRQTIASTLPRSLPARCGAVGPNEGVRAMTIAFRCVECAAEYDVDDELSGKTIRCRDCHGFGRVALVVPPTATTPSRTSTASSLTNLEAVQSKFRLRQRFSFRHGLLLGVGLASAVSLLFFWLGLGSHGDGEKRVLSPSPEKRQAANLPASQPVQSPVQRTPVQPAVQRMQAQPPLAPRNQQPFDPRQQQAEWERRQAEVAQLEMRRQAEMQAQLLAREKEMAAEVERKRQEKLAQEFALLGPGDRQGIKNAIQTLISKTQKM